MRSRARYVLVVVAGLMIGGCRQADGELPSPDAVVQEELVDVVRDLQNIATGRDPQGPADLADDLRKYARRPEAEPVVDELSRRAAAAVTGLDLPDQAAQRMAHSLWAAIAARELSERQVESMKNDVRLLLVSIGVSDANAQQISDQVGAVQGAVSARPRRWYEVF
jgi:hypothetical protein